MLLVELNFARPLTSPPNFFCELSQYIIFSRISDFRKIFESAAFKVQLNVSISFLYSDEEDDINGNVEN